MENDEKPKGAPVFFFIALAIVAISIFMSFREEPVKEEIGRPVQALEQKEQAKSDINVILTEPIRLEVGKNGVIITDFIYASSIDTNAIPSAVLIKASTAELGELIIPLSRIKYIRYTRGGNL